MYRWRGPDILIMMNNKLRATLGMATLQRCDIDIYKYYTVYD